MKHINQVSDSEITKYYQPKPTPKPNLWKSTPNLTKAVDTTDKVVNVASKALGLDRLHNYLAFKAPKISLPTTNRCPHCGK